MRNSLSAAIIRTVVLALSMVLFSTGARAIDLLGSDDFSNSAASQMRWGPDIPFAATNGGTLHNSGGRLQWSTTTTNRVELMRPWALTPVTCADWWEATLDLSSSGTIPRNSSAVIGLRLCTPGAVPGSPPCASLDVLLRLRCDSAGSLSTTIASLLATNGLIVSEHSESLASTNCQVRLFFGPEGYGWGGIYAWYAPQGGTSEPQWSLLYSTDSPSYDPAWKAAIKGADPLQLAVFASSENAALAEGILSADNFLLRDAYWDYDDSYKWLSRSFDNGDDFNDNYKDTTKWGADVRADSYRTCSETNGRLEFVATSTADGEVARPWIGFGAACTRAWEVSADLQVDASGSRTNSQCSSFLRVLDLGDDHNPRQNTLTVSLQHNRLSSGSDTQSLVVFFRRHRVYTLETNLCVVPADSVERIRITHDVGVTNRLLTVWRGATKLAAVNVFDLAMNPVVYQDRPDSTGWSGVYSAVFGGEYGFAVGAYFGNFLSQATNLVAVDNFDLRTLPVLERQHCGRFSNHQGMVVNTHIPYRPIQWERVFSEIAVTNMPGRLSDLEQISVRVTNLTVNTMPSVSALYFSSSATLRPPNTTRRSQLFYFGFFPDSSCPRPPWTLSDYSYWSDFGITSMTNLVYCTDPIWWPSLYPYRVLRGDMFFSGFPDPDYQEVRNNSSLFAPYFYAFAGNDPNGSWMLDAEVLASTSPEDQAAWLAMDGWDLILQTVQAMDLTQKSLIGTDDFADNTKDTAKWGTDIADGPVLAARLEERNGGLEFSSSSSSNCAAIRPWILNFGSYTQNWDIQASLGFSSSLYPTATNGSKSVFIAVGSRPATAGEIPTNYFVFRLERTRDSGGVLQQRLVPACWTGDAEVGDGTTYAVTAADRETVHLTFDASAKTLMAMWNGQVLRQVNLAAGGSGWGMTSNSLFAVYIGGMMDDPSPAGADQGYVDDFQVTSWLGAGLANLTNTTFASIGPGGSVSFFTPWLNYDPATTLQWYLNGTAMPGSNGPSLTIASASALQAGAYSVVASNSAGVFTNVVGVLTLVRPALEPNGQPRLEIAGAPGWTYQIQQRETLAPSNSWQVLTNLVLPSNQYPYVDSTFSPVTQRRFYRVLPVP